MVFPSVTTVVKCVGTTLQQAIQIAIDLGLSRVVFIIDCQLVVNAVLNNSFFIYE